MEVIMVAYMDAEAVKRTIGSERTCFWSRSRKTYWQKGETSGNIQRVKSINYDCDADCLLIQVEQTGAGCHTGAKSCFHNALTGIKRELPANQIADLLDVIYQRKNDMPSNSYTAKLMSDGLQKINSKIKEESYEVIEAAEIKDKSELIWEISDLLYHLLVLAAYKDITMNDIDSELAKRSK